MITEKHDESKYPAKYLILGIICFVLAVATFIRYEMRKTVSTRSRGGQVVLKLGYRPRTLADPTPAVIKELFPPASLKIELVPVSTVADGFVKLSTGEIDGFAGVPLEAIFQQIANPQLKTPFYAYALSVDRSGDEWVSMVARKGSGIQKLSDAAGKVVACAPTDQAEYLTRQILLANGVPADQIKIVRHNPQNPLLGFRSGEYDMILTAEPIISLALAEGASIVARGPISKYLFSGADVPVAASILTESFSKAHPDALKTLGDLVLNATALMRKTPEKTREIFGRPEYGGLSPEIRARFAFAIMVRADSSTTASLKLFADRLSRDGVLKNPVDVARLFPPQP